MTCLDKVLRGEIERCLAPPRQMHKKTRNSYSQPNPHKSGTMFLDALWCLLLGATLTYAVHEQLRGSVSNTCLMPVSASRWNLR